MKKFSIAALELARKDPVNFAKSLNESSFGSNSFGGRPKSMKWFDAVMVYHDTLDISLAIKALQHSFSNRIENAKNTREVENLVLSLQRYIREHEKLGYINHDRRVSIKIELSSEVKITGWIWLLNMKPDKGFVGYIVSKGINESRWELELRFPVLQDYIANTLYKCSSDIIEVGIVDYATGKHYMTSFSKEYIKNAMKELHKIGGTISSYLINNKYS